MQKKLERVTLADRKRYTTQFLALAVFIFAAALYIRTAAPTLGGAFDSEEFQHAAYTLGIAHATGYPLYLILGKLFTTFVPLGNIAYRMNLLSALIGAGTAVLVFLNAMQLTRRPLASLAAAAVFATNPAVWRQAGVASVGPLHLFLVAAILYALLLWQAKRVPLSLAVFLFGLSLTHHRSTLLLAPAIAVFVLLVDFDLLRRPRDLARTALWLALPLVLYLYMPVFGNNSPWYSNTFQGFIGEISGGDAGDFIRAAPSEIAQGIVLVSEYLFDSFGYLGLGMVIVGVFWSGGFSRLLTAKSTKPAKASTPNFQVSLLLGLCTLIFSIWGTIYAGEPDRYIVLPFVFLIYWFAIGIAAFEDVLVRLPYPHTPTLARALLTAALALPLLLPFGERFRIADWSSFDRVYKQWDEIFTLPLPRNAVLVGNWGQLNAMRYMQRVENRRGDLQLVGTLYDPEPQTQAAQNAFADGRTLFLSPGIPLPTGTYRYGQVGPLLEVYDAPQMQQPVAARNMLSASSLGLYNVAVTTALEPYAPTQTIAPNRTARFAFTWRAEDTVNDFIIRIGLYDPEGHLIAQKDEPPIRGLYPASKWQRGEYVNDVHNLLIPAGSPPGQHSWQVAVLDSKTKAIAIDKVASGTFVVERATTLTRDQVFIQHPLDIQMSPYAILWGYGGIDGTHHAGETITLNLLWYASDDSVRKYAPRKFTVYILDSLGHRTQTWAWEDLITFYSAREWRRGEMLKAYYDLRLSDALPPGEYSLGLIYGLGSSDAVILGKIQIAP